LESSGVDTLERRPESLERLFLRLPVGQAFDLGGHPLGFGFSKGVVLQTLRVAQPKCLALNRGLPFAILFFAKGGPLFASSCSAEAIHHASAAVQSSILTIHCKTLNNLIPACYPVPVFAATQPRRSLDFFSRLTPVPCPLSLNSFICHISENLSLIPSIATLPQTCVSKRTVCHTPSSPGTLRLFDVRTFRQTCGRSNVLSSYPLYYQGIVHSFALNKNSTPLFSSDSALFAQKPGVGEESTRIQFPSKTGRLAANGANGRVEKAVAHRCARLRSGGGPPPTIFVGAQHAAP